MDRTPKNYQEAAKVFAGRKDKDLGRKISNQNWMKYDPKRDCYVLFWPGDKYVKDASGRYEYQSRDKWTHTHYAEIHRDKIVLLKYMPNTQIARLGLQSKKSTTVKHEGRQWTCREGHSIFVNEDDPITYSNETLTAPPAAERVLDVEKRAEFQKLIIKVRKAFTARYKLGAFQHVDEKAVIKSVEKLRASSRNNVSSLFYAALLKVDEENIESYYPLIGICYHYTRCTRALCYRRDAPNILLLAFEYGIKACRKNFYDMHGITKYEVPT